MDQILRQLLIQKSVKSSSIGSKDCCLVQQNAKMSVLQRMIENKKGRKEKRSKGVLRDSKLITENEELKFFPLSFSRQ
jgi:hypothetical protein